MSSILSALREIRAAFASPSPPAVAAANGTTDITFEQELRSLFPERAKTLHWLVLIAYPAFWLVDRQFAPPHLIWPFFGLRLLVVGACAIGLALLYSSLGPRIAQPAVFINGLLCSVGVSFISTFVGGMESAYYSGLIFIILVTGYFMPWALPVNLAFGGISISAHVFFHWLQGSTDSSMVVPMVFLLASLAFSAVATAANRQTLLRDSNLRRELARANDDLKELDAAKSRFFANVSHELRTPLTLIIAPLDSLKQQLAGSEAERLIAAMGTNAQRLLRQVDAVLDIAKLESGTLRLQLVTGNLGRLASELLDSAYGAARRKDLTLRRAGLDDLPDSEFDEEKAWIMVGNLISNALKFTEQGSIEVSAQQRGEFIELVVTDTGPGIPSESLPRIFDRFYQVDDSSRRQHGGAGIGLALARELARLHGGDLVVESKAGAGARFTLSLPTQPAQQLDRRQQPRRREDRVRSLRAETRAGQELERRRGTTVLADLKVPQLAPDAPAETAPLEAPVVLLADDNDDLRSYMAKDLATQYRVLTAKDGVEALALLQTCHVDIVVSDIMMPRLSGEDLVQEIRKDRAIAAIPVILVTAKAASEDVIRGLLEGANDYVTKPFIVAELKARIAAQLRARDAEARMNEQTSRLAAIGQMSSAVAHDLRNAVTIVQGYTELARRANRDAQLDAPLAEVLKAADRLTRMTQEILDVARGGTPRLQLEDVAVREFLERILQPLGMDLKRRGIELVLDLDLEPSDVAPLDRDRVTRIMENLLRNAREALSSHAGERRVRISAHADAAGELVLAVADSGPGIPAGEEHLVFQPFHSGKGGSGLGLATVRNIVLAHGGSVSVIGHGDEGGATFYFRLPLRTDAAAAGREPARAAGPSNWTYTH